METSGATAHGAEDVTARIARGWYPDPEDATRERWYDGAEWTPHTHRALGRASMFGAAYDRGMWPGPNRLARLARRYSAISLFLFLGALLATLILDRSVEIMTVAGIGMLALAATATAQTVLAARAVRRARLEGAMTLSVIHLVQGSFYVFFSGLYLLMGLVIAIVY